MLIDDLKTLREVYRIQTILYRNDNKPAHSYAGGVIDVYDYVIADLDELIEKYVPVDNNKQFTITFNGNNGDKAMTWEKAMWSCLGLSVIGLIAEVYGAITNNSYVFLIAFFVTLSLLIIASFCNYRAPYVDD